jgi:hypothetical protein
MIDAEIRAIVLQKFYDRRQEGRMINANQLGITTTPYDEVLRICDQLAEKHLIKFTSTKAAGGIVVHGAGRITACGVDVVERQADPPFPINFDFSHRIDVRDSSNVQVGNANVQTVIEIDRIFAAIDSSNASESDKAEVKSLFNKFLEHPLVSAILGAAATKAMGG